MVLQVGLVPEQLLITSMRDPVVTNQERGIALEHAAAALADEEITHQNLNT